MIEKDLELTWQIQHLRGLLSEEDRFMLNRRVREGDLLEDLSLKESRGRRQEVDSGNGFFVQENGIVAFREDVIVEEFKFW